MRVYLVLAILASVGLAGCTVTGESITYEAPEWRSGYTWSYNWTSDERSHYAEAYEGEEPWEGWYNSTNDGTTITEVLNTTLEIDGVPIYLVARGENNFYLEGVRRFDLAELDLDVNYDWNCGATDCVREITEVSIWDQPDELLRFPLISGQSYEPESYREVDPEYAEINARYEALYSDRARVGALTTVETPLGMIDAVPVTHTVELTDPQGLKQLIEEDNVAEGDDMQFSRFEVREKHVVTSYYSDLYGVIVKQAIDRSQHWDVAGTYQGENWAESGNSEYQYEQVLAGASSAARPERSLEQAAVYLGGGVTPIDPTGQAVGQATYTLELDADKTVINQGAGDSFGFTVELLGEETLPEGHAIHWNVAAAGKTIDQATGTSFTYTPERPGAFTVAVESQDPAGAVVARDDVIVYADYLATVTAECGAVWAGGSSPGGPSGCETYGLPVYEDARSILIRAQMAGGQNVSSGNPDLRLTTNEGWTRDGYTESTGVILLQDSLYWDAPDGSDWAIDLTPYTAVDTDAQFEIEVYYSKDHLDSEGGVGMGRTSPFTGLLSEYLL